MGETLSGHCIRRRRAYYRDEIYSILAEACKKAEEIFRTTTKYRALTERDNSRGAEKDRQLA